MAMNEFESLLGPIESSAVQRALNFWVDIGVLAADPEGRYTVLEKAGERALQEPPTHREGTQRGSSLYDHSNNSHLSDILDIVEDSMSNQRNDKKEAEQMRVYWQVSTRVDLSCGLADLISMQFIQGILTNLGPQPLQKIQSMLGLAPGYDRTPEQLGHLLEALRREGMLEVQDALWRLTAK
jgi:anaphase-promoting complex subunit 2